MVQVDPPSILFRVRTASGEVLEDLSYKDIAQALIEGRLEGDEMVQHKDRNPWIPMVADPTLHELVLLVLEGKSIELPGEDQQSGSALRELADLDGIEINESTRTISLLGLKPIGGAKEVEEVEQNLEQSEAKPESEISFDEEEDSFNDGEKTVVPEASSQGSESEIYDRSTVISQQDSATSSEPPPSQNDEETDLFTEKEIVPVEPKEIAITGATKAGPIQKKGRTATSVGMSSVTNRSKTSSKSKTATGMRRGTKILLILSVIYLFLDTMTTQDENKGQELRIPQVVAIQPLTTDRADPEKSRELLQQGIEFLRLGYANATFEASKLFRRSAELNSKNDGVPRAYLAIAYSRLLPFAKDRYSQLMIIADQISQANRSTATPAMVTAARAEYFLAKDNPVAALQILDSFKRVDALNEDHKYVLVRALLANGRYTESAQTTSRLLQESLPKTFQLVLGRAYEGRGEGENALGVYDSLISKHEGYGAAWLRKALIHAKLDQWDEAARSLARALEKWKQLYPKDASEALELLAAIKSREGEVESTVKYLSRAVRVDPENERAARALIEFTDQAQLNVRLARRWKKRFEVEELIEQGKALAQTGDLQEASIRLFKAGDTAEGIPYPHIEAGKVFLDFGMADAASKSFQKAIKVDPSSLKASEGYGRSLVNSYRWKKAYGALVQFREKYPSHPLFPQLLGDYYRNQGSLSEASKMYRIAVDLSVFNRDAYVNLGKIAMQLDALTEAEAYFLKAVESDPLAMEPHALLAEMLKEREGYDTAIGYLTEQMNAYPGEPELILAVTKLYFEKGDATASNRYLQVAKEQASNHWKYHRLKARRAMNDGEPEEALKHWDKMSDLNPENPSGYLQRANYFLETAQFDRVREELDKIASRVEAWPGLQLGYAKLFSELGNYQKAYEKVQKEIDFHPGNPDAHAFLGDLYMMDGQVDKALISYREALKIDRNHFRALLGQGKATRMRGSAEGALTILRRAVEVDSGSPEIYRELGYTYLQLGRYPEARENLERYLTMKPDAEDRGDVYQALQDAGEA